MDQKKRWKKEGMWKDVSEEELAQVFSGHFDPFERTLAGEFKVVRPPASNKDIKRLLTALGDLPASYLHFLQEADGVEGCAGDDDQDYLTLWSSGELVENNASFPVHQVWPELLLIGNDGRGGWVAFHRTASQNPETWPVVHVTPESSCQTDGRQLASSFQGWRREGFSLRPGGFVCGGG